MQDQKQNSEQNNQKPFLSSLTAKIILALVIFLGSVIIIISGMKFIIQYYKIQNDNQTVKPVDKIIEHYNNTKITKIELTNDWKICNQNSDCVETQLRCCGCESGGIQTGINKKYLKYWNDVLEKKCKNIGCISLFNCKNGEAICENSKCEFQKKIENCGKEGELVNPENLKGKTSYPDICCSGLKGLGSYGINNNGECEVLTGTPFLTCMPCGNGICEEINNFKENKCNCPEDCGDKIDTSDWQTYRNEEFGFEMKFPSDWRFRSHAKTIGKTVDRKVLSRSLFFGPFVSQKNLFENSQVTISVDIIFGKGKDIKKEMDKQKLLGIPDRDALIVEYDTFVNNIKSTQLKISYPLPGSSNNLKIFTYTTYKDNLYIIDLSLISIADENVKQEIIDIYNQILSTFKFIEN
ncbi:MAG: hypothetical protein U9O55_02090 [Patescibacteria group bacterium]|nr:hypothetical protein [Patescibacteria group bacterium]